MRDVLQVAECALGQLQLIHGSSERSSECEIYIVWKKVTGKSEKSEKNSAGNFGTGASQTIIINAQARREGPKTALIVP